MQFAYIEKRSTQNIPFLVSSLHASSDVSFCNSVSLFENLECNLMEIELFSHPVNIFQHFSLKKIKFHCIN